MGKSYHDFDKGAPKRRVKDDEEEDFDWRDALRKAEIEEEADDKAEREAQLEEGELNDESEEE